LFGLYAPVFQEIAPSIAGQTLVCLPSGSSRRPIS
jgi:hypothetical protein